MITNDRIKEIEKTGGKEGLNFIAEMCPDIEEQRKSLEKVSDPAALPIFGLPLFIKDNVDVKGTHTTAGSLALSDNLAETDAPVVRNLRKNGALILGKSNMTEFANYTTPGMPAGYSSRGGQVIHAVNPSYSPSGSSSGSAVAVSSKSVPAAIGTDTSFSVIACAQENGICGLKPSAGALPDEGIIPIARTLDSAGVLSWDFSTALKVYGAMRDEPFIYKPAEIKGMRIALNLANAYMVSEEHMRAINRFIGKMREAGAVVSYIDQEPIPLQRIIMQYEFKDHLEDYLDGSNASRKTLKEIVDYYEANPETMKKYGDGFLMGALLEASESTKAEKYLDTMKKREEIRQSVLEELSDFDVAFLTGPTNIMHFTGLPSATFATDEQNSKGYRRCFITYGADEKKLFEAVLGMEKADF